MRRALKIGLRVGAVLLGLLLLAFAALLFLVYTGPGRDIVRARVEREIEGALAAEARIDRLRLSLSGKVEVIGLSLRDRDGVEVVSGSVLLDVSVRALLGGSIRLSELLIRDLRVDLDRLEGILPPDDPDAEPLPALSIDRFELTGGALAAGGHEITGLAARGRVTVDRQGELEAVLAELAATLRLGDLEVRAVAGAADTSPAIELRGLRLTARDLRIEAGDSFAHLAVAAVDLRRVEASAVVDLALEPADLRALSAALERPPGPEAQLAAGLRGRLHVAGGLGGARGAGSDPGRPGAEVARASPRSWSAVGILAGEVGGATAVLAATVAGAGGEAAPATSGFPVRAQGAVMIRGFRPHEVLLDAPPSASATIDLVAGADVSGDLTAGFDRLRGTLGIHARGDAAGLPIEELIVRADASPGGALTARADLRAAPGPGARSPGIASAELALSRDERGGAVVKRAVVAASGLRFADVGELAAKHGAAPAPGDLPRGEIDRVEISGAGPLDALEVRGEVRLRRLRHEDLAVATASGEVHVTLDAGALVGEGAEEARERTLGSISGRASARAAGVVVSGRPLGTVSATGRFDDAGKRLRGAATYRGPEGERARARFDVALEEDRIRIRVPDLAASARGLALTGRAGQVVIHQSGAVDVTDASLRSPAGSVTAAGRVPAPGGDRSRRIRIELEDVDLGRLARALAVDDVPEALASGALEIGRAGRDLTASVRFNLRDVALVADGPPLAVDARLELGGGRAAVEAEVELLGEKARATLSASGRVPRDLLDAGAWERVGPDHLEQVAAELRELELELVGRMLGEPLPRAMTGTLTAGIEGENDGTGLDLDARIDVARLTSTVDGPGPSLPVADLRGRVRLRGPRAELDLRARIPGEPALARASAALAVPRDRFDLDAWKGLGMDDVEKASARVRRLDLDLLARALGEDLPAGGVITARAELPERSGAPGARRDLAYRVVVYRGRVAGLDRLTARVEGTFGDELAGELSLSHHGAPIARGSFAAGLSLADLAGDVLPLPEKISIRGDLSVADLQLRRLHEAGLLAEPLSGVVEAELAVTGTADRWQARLERGRVRRLGVRDVRMEVDEIAGSVEMAGSTELVSLRGKLAGRQESGGTVSLAAAYRAGDEANASLSLEARRFDLRVLRALATEPTHPLAEAEGRLDASLRLAGAPEAPTGRGRIEIRGFRVLLDEGAHRIEGIDLSLRLDRDRLRLDRSLARIGEGRVQARGEVRLAGLVPRDLSLVVRAHRVPVIADRFRIEIGAEARVVGKLGDDGLDVGVTITRGDVEVDDTGRALQDLGDLADVVYVDSRAEEERLRAEQRAARGPGVMPEIRVTVRSSQPLTVTHPMAELHVNPSLRLRIREREELEIVGYVEVERGHVELYDYRYQVVVAKAEFDGPPDDPVLDLRLTRDFPAGAVTIQVHGRAEAPEIVLSDDVGRDPLQVLVMMTGGDPDNPEREREAAANAAGSLIAAHLRDVLPIEFHVTRKTEKGYEAGRWFDFFFGPVLVLYRYSGQAASGPGQNQNEAVLEWHPFRNWMLEVVPWGDGSARSADALWIHRF